MAVSRLVEGVVSIIEWSWSKCELSMGAGQMRLVDRGCLLDGGAGCAFRGGAREVGLVVEGRYDADSEEAVGIVLVDGEKSHSNTIHLGHWKVM